MIPSRRQFCALALGAVLLCGAWVPDAVGASLAAGRILFVEPATTWVGIARVHLEIDELRQSGDNLEGRYTIRVPLAPSQNDTGYIRLEAPDSLVDHEATVIGSATSTTGQIHPVVARIRPDGAVRIDVTTAERKLRFKSRFTLRDAL